MAEHCREATTDISQTRQCLVEPERITRPEGTAETLPNFCNVAISIVLSGRAGIGALYPAHRAGLMSEVAPRLRQFEPRCLWRGNLSDAPRAGIFSKTACAQKNSFVFFRCSFLIIMTPVVDSQSAAVPAAAKRSDLEIKDAHLIFGSIWRQLEREFGHEKMRFPKEIILLGGAPGAGKGTNTAFIAKVRGLTCQPIVMSSLLKSPEAKALKAAGDMVGDRDVVELLLRELLRPEYQDGVILDGFPRTNVQVECLKLLVDHMQALRREFYNTPLSIHFRQP